jgi:PAS domain S-box-containing protein
MALALERRSSQGVVEYGVAVAAVIVALLVRLAINDWLGPNVPFLQFFPAILAASWYGGFKPGVLAVTLSAVAAYAWFLLPTGLVKVPSAVDLFALTLSVIVGTGIAFLGGMMKDTEAAQHLASGRWRTTLASIGDAVIVTDHAGHITFVNIVAERLTGWDAASALNRPLSDVFTIINDETTETVETSVDRVLREGTPPGLARYTMLKSRDGVLTPVAQSAAPIRDERGLVDGVVLVFRDLTAEREASSALKRSESLLHAIVENSQAVIYAKDVDGRYLLINRRFAELFHVTREGIRGKTDYDLFSTEAADRFREMDLRVAADGVALTDEEVVPQDDGVHTYISVKCPLWDERGNIYAVFGISTDITDRKRSEEAFRANDERIRLVLETSLDAVITIDTAGVITGWSRQAELTFGWAAQEVIGRSLSDTIIPPRFREEHRRGLEKFLSTGEGPALGRRLELSALDRTGRELPIEIAITPVLVGRALSFSAFVRDITDRKESEERLRAQLERLNLLDRLTRAIGERQDLPSILEVVVRSLEDHLPLDFCCVCVYDAADHSLTVSRVGTKSERLASELAMTEGTRLAIDANGLSRCVRGQLVYEPEIAGVPTLFPQRLARAGLHSFVAAPLLVESSVFGMLFAARHTASGFSSAECEFLRQLSEHVALAAHQAQLYTALQQAYEDLRQTQQAVMQQERLKALGQMASGIAHDINNAISPVALYTETLLESEPNLSARARRYVETIQRATDDVAQTVARMRDFYRLREPELKLAPVRINPLIDEVVNLTRARWSDMPQQRGVVIDMVTELTTDPPLIQGVESEIREALINLIFNAVDAMPDGGRLTVRTRLTDVAYSSRQAAPSRRLHVEVSDSGIGMNLEIRRRCFEPFFTTKGERGTGLGLAMVYGMVQRHGAEIDIDTAPGHGTTMRLVFDVSETAIVDLGTPAAAYARPSRLRILIVDDDPLLLKSLRDALEGDGHAVTAAGGGQAGIDTFLAAEGGNGAPFEVVITDLGMPYIDGRQVANIVKSAAPSTPVVLLTGWGQRLVDAGEVPKNVDRVLNKPPRLADLRPVLAELQRRAKA